MQPDVILRVSRLYVVSASILAVYTEKTMVRLLVKFMYCGLVGVSYFNKQTATQEKKVKRKVF